MKRCVAHKGPSGAFVTYCNISCFCSSVVVFPSCLIRVLLRLLYFWEKRKNIHSEFKFSDTEKPTSAIARVGLSDLKYLMEIFLEIKLKAPEFKIQETFSREVQI